MYHAAVDTNNGVESQNKMLKYNFLPRNTKLTLSTLVTVLNEEFLPDMHHKHMVLNHQMLPTYRAYNFCAILPPWPSPPGDNTLPGKEKQL